MTRSWEDPSADEPVIVEVHGTPNAGRRGVLTREERSLWVRFRNWLFPLLDDQLDDSWTGDAADPLIGAYRGGSVKDRSCAGAQTVTDASDLAAKMDLDRALEEVEIKDQPEFQSFLEGFNEQRIDEHADATFARFMEMHPDVPDHVERVRVILQRLRLTRGTMIRVMKGARPSPAAPEGEAPP